MRTVRRRFTRRRLPQLITIIILATILIIALLLLLRRFYLENSEVVPIRGGTYIEGSVGAIHNLNPWFTVRNDVNRDIISLVFSGLQRYNPFTGQIENDMATLEISGNERIYTLTLRDNLFWHDSTDELPHPVTADDVVFTYETIKKQGFPNPILQANFRGIDIEKIDDRRIQFRLEKPYFFFKSNLTLGILPKNYLVGIPADRLPQALDFNLSPVGCGPYKFVSMVETELATEVTLQHWDNFHGARPFIGQIIFRAFPDYPSLLSDLRNLNGVRHVPRNKEGKAIIPNRYNTFHYTLPQYVALFFNLEKEILDDQKLRLGLQLGINKQETVNTINETSIVDTLLLEIAEKDWQYQFDPDAGKGALFDSNWHLPQKIRLQELQIQQEINLTGALNLPQPVVLLETGAILTVTGSMVPSTSSLLLNGKPVRTIHFGSQSGTWIAQLPTDGSSGSLVLGPNALKLTESGGKIIDTYWLTRTSAPKDLRALREEQKLLALYGQRDGTLTIDDLRTTEDGFLRKKKTGEEQGIRRNEKGEPLHLTLLTSNLPHTYAIVAKTIADQWRSIGVETEVLVLNREEFNDRVIRRDYDVLLFGQPLLDNLDSYPFWHSSQSQIIGKEAPELRLEANNLSQYRNFKADALLEQIRETHDPEQRKQALSLLKDVFREDIPAVVLYSPTYVFAVSDRILGVDLGTPSLHSDRFLGVHRWFIREGRTFREKQSWILFIPWLFSQFSGHGSRD